jgi:LPXTG-site transpeptidase (sortase) family protein
MSAVAVPADQEIGPAASTQAGAAGPAAQTQFPQQWSQSQPEPAVFSARRVASTAMLILSASLLGFVGYLAVFSGLHYDRAQFTAYANFRSDLAQAVAPIGPTQPNNPSALLALGTPVAVLEIPRLKMRTVVFEGTNGEVLESGPGHLRSTVMPGQAGTSEIMGRATAYGGPFGRISRLRKGDRISVINGQGTAEYRVADVRRAGDRVFPLAAGKGRLTLVTADGLPFIPSDALRVDADLTSAAQPSPGGLPPTSTLPSSEKVLATDATAWLPVVLWGQALVLSAGAITWARARWGRWQVWIVAVPLLTYLGLSIADQLSRLLLNLM